MGFGRPHDLGGGVREAEIGRAGRWAHLGAHEVLEEVGGGLGVAEGGVGLTLADARRLAAVGQASPHLSEHGRIRDVSLSDAVNVGGADRTSWMPRSRLGATRTAN